MGRSGRTTSGGTRGSCRRSSWPTPTTPRTRRTGKPWWTRSSRRAVAASSTTSWYTWTARRMSGFIHASTEWMRPCWIASAEGRVMFRRMRLDQTPRHAGGETRCLSLGNAGVIKMLAGLNDLPAVIAIADDTPDARSLRHASFLMMPELG